MTTYVKSSQANTIDSLVAKREMVRHFAATNGVDGGPHLVDLTGALLGGKMYIFGGNEFTGNMMRATVSNRLYAFDLQENQWSILMPGGPKPDARKESAACLAKDIFLAEQLLDSRYTRD